MNRRKELFFIILIALFVLSSVISYNLNSDLKKTDKNIQNDEINEIDEVRAPKKSWFNNSMDPIVIDNIASKNWTWARKQEWCRLGDGSRGNPYIIENITIDASGSGNGIEIRNSKNVYFEINNCTVYNLGTGSSDAGIKLFNTTNGKIINNECSLNKNGIYLEQSNNNTVSGNVASYNELYGIYLEQSSNNTILGNTAFENDQYGIWLKSGNDNIVSENIFSSNEFYGIFLQDSNNNTVSRNTANYNWIGIYLEQSNNNTISRNTVYFNQWGVLLGNSKNNTIWGNLIKYNNVYGIWLVDSNCQNNLIYFNSIKQFIGIHANDLGTNTRWDHLGIGNYWNTHTFPDNNNDGIVDTSYIINDSAGIEDNFPLIKSPVHDGERIHIDDSGIKAWNWSKTAKLNVWCSGSGTEEDPYVIQDLTINIGYFFSSILIENSNAYFRIENCQIYNARLAAAIKLYKTFNGKIINSDFSLNKNGIYLEQSNNNNISGNIVNNNDNGIGLLYSDNNTISGNTANNNYYGIGLYGSSNNTIFGNLANNNIYGIYLLESNNNTVSRNILVLNVFFIEEDNCIENIIKKDNRCYTTILPSGINEVKIEPYGVDDIDVGMEIALDNETEVIFSAFNENNIEEAPLNDGLIFMNLQLNDTNNLDQSIDAPINFILEFATFRYIPLDVFWFNESANDGHGAWKKLSYIDLSNGKILISVNHTSIFAITGLILPNPSSDNDSDDDVYDFLFLILIGFICSLTIAIASSTYYHKTRIQTRAKPPKKEVFMRKPLVRSYDKKFVKSPNLEGFVEKKNLLRIFEGKNVLEKPALLNGLKFNVISNEFREKLDQLELDEEDFTDLLNDLLSFTPKERLKIIDRLLELK